MQSDGRRKMRLDHLPAGSPDCPLLRLWDFTPDQAQQLHAAIVGLAAGITREVEVHRLPFIRAAEDCRLILHTLERESAIAFRCIPFGFEYVASQQAWDNVAGLIEPFAQGESGYQWLARPAGGPALLLSADGRW